MKSLLLLVIGLLLGGQTVKAQQTLVDSIFHDGIYRTYILYIPASYSAANAVPLVMNFHGYTSNASQQLFYGDFRPIADTAGFLLVHPQGTLDGSNQPYWNSNWGGAVDDIGFTEALIDSLSAQYSILQSRVYSTGMSNGGFMSYTLACSLSERIAAIASVTGSMNFGQSINCDPQHPMPVMEIHGTSDGVVPYNGSATVSSIPNTLSYWVNTNVCDLNPTQTAVPNTNLGDGCTATHFVYSNGNNGVNVEHFRIDGGGHTWPGAPIVVGVTNYDIDASKEIWRFFSRYDIYGSILTTDELEAGNFSVFPNPASNSLEVTSANNETINTIHIINQSGKLVFEPTAPTKNIDISSLSEGLYLLQIGTESGTHFVKFIKE